MKYIRNLLFCFIAITPIVAAEDSILIEIVEGVEIKVPVAVVPFGQTPNDALNTINFSIDGVIRNDLKRTGRFDPISPELYLSQPATHDELIFTDWRLIQVEYVLIGNVERIGDQYQIVSRLYDVFGQQQIFGVQYRVAEPLLRKTAHLLANQMFENITGSRSSFDSKILYTTTARLEDNGVRHRLFLADYDGYNEQQLFESSYPILSPTWSPDSTKIAYSVLDPKQSKIYIQTVATGDSEPIENIEGHARSPNWSPDGGKLAFAQSKEGNSDIYVLDLDSGQISQLTTNLQIDTEPSWSPDGKHLVFTSNRGTSAQIYKVDVEAGSRAERVTIAGKSNTAAVFHPEGAKLALINSEFSSSRVAIYDLESNEINVISSTFIDDSVNYSPYGDMLMYVVEGADRHLRTLSPNGSTQSRILVRGGAVKQVSWETRKLDEN